MESKDLMLIRMQLPDVYIHVYYMETITFLLTQQVVLSNLLRLDIDDVKNYYNKYISPSVTKFHVVGKIDQSTTMASLNDLNTKWAAKEVTIPEFPVVNNRDNSSLLFVDIPNAKQSVINIGNIGLARTDKDFYAAEVMNYSLGGAFNGVVNMILREEKGYTYGARTRFSGSKIPGTFTASSSVRTNTTGESVQIFKDEIAKYKNGISEEDLEFTKNALIKSNARRFETQFALLGMLQERSAYDLPANYIEGEEATVRSRPWDSTKHWQTNIWTNLKWPYLVVGDAATQFAQFEKWALTR